MSAVPTAILAAARDARRVAILTGAGMSADSGVPTFRDTGAWDQRDADRYASVRAWQERPEEVWAWHWQLARLVRGCEPHAGHHALARWAARVRLTVATQNIDDLHERAGIADPIHLHGRLLEFACAECGTPVDLAVPPLTVADAQRPERLDPPSCADCGGDVRPMVTWFGEHLPPGAFDEALDAVLEADLLLVVGTSAIVQPVGSLPHIARGHGVTVVEINPAPTEISMGVDLIWRERAAVALEALVAAL